MSHRLKTAIGLLIVILLAAGIVLAGTGRRTSSTSPSIPTSASVRMKWFFSGTMAPWFAGKEQGFFRDAGIDLAILPGGPDNSAVKLVAAGTDTFGVTGADEVLLARQKGIPIVAIAVLFKDSPVVFIAKKTSGITSPSDWNGKKIEVSYGDNVEIQYRALLKKFGVQNVKEVPYSFNLAPFLQDKVDVSIAYRMDQAVTLERQGVAINIMTPKDYGVNPYGDVVITTEETFRNNPALVRAFVRAALQSFQWAIAHPTPAVTSLISAVPDLKQENEEPVWNASIPFVVADEPSLIGQMRNNRWQETMETLLEFKFLSSPINLTKAFQNVAAP